MKKPKEPPVRIVEEKFGCPTSELCNKCGSTQEYKKYFFGFGYGGYVGCHQPECKNYYEKLRCYD